MTETMSEASDLPETTQNYDHSESVSVEWNYSGKAMRAQGLLFLIISLLLIGGAGWAIYAKWLNVYPALIAAAVCLILLWGYYFALYYYRTMTIRYRLTERHLYAYRGLLTRTSDSMELILVEDVRLTQTLFDRIFNGGVGKITLFCIVDKTDQQLVLEGIDRPAELFETINSLRTALRAKRSILTGSM